MKLKMQKIHFTKARLKNQWHDHVTLTLDDRGRISDIRTGDQAPGPDTERVAGYALPGMPNIHSHAFQRAMAGLAEYRTSGGAGRRDSFWTWRDVMYRFAQKLSPDDLYHIARQLYVEMLRAGYTAVAEFHYLHHQPGGAPYDNPAEMSLAISRAAADAGLDLTLLPVLYQAAGFGGQPLSPEQARFGHSAAQYCQLLDLLHDSFQDDPTRRLGVAFHSLRAVPPESFDPVIRHLDSLSPDAPIHIHIAEQTKEVEDCRQWSGQRPVEWLLAHQALNERWCLVHATHLTENETSTLAQSGAVAGICPTTEANLGDGLFPLKSYLDQGGRIAIGSDSHISVSPVEELRLLEYGQRLHHQSRNIVATAEQPHTGERLYQASLQGGRRAMGRRDAGAIAVGRRADLIVLDATSPLLCATPDRYLLDRFIFSGNDNPVKDVMVAGRWRIRDRHHPQAAAIAGDFRRTMTRLMTLLD